VQAIPEWLERDPSPHPRPPATTRLQELPFGDLSWENFERLCLRLVRTRSDVEDCRLYGTAGQFQAGIDLYARKTLADKFVVYQCKRADDFGPAKIAAAVEEFLNGTWASRSSELVLCTKEDLRTTQREEEIEKQRIVLQARGIAFTTWDVSELNIQLKRQFQIIDDFFGRAWVEAYCGSASLEQVTNRVDGPGATNIRADLKRLYSITFKADDPGLPTNVLEQRYFPLEERYIVPDILLTRQTVLESSTKEQASRSAQHELPSRDRNHKKRFTPDRRTVNRQAVDQWLRDKRHSVILAGAGMGKSTLLRFLALDLLSDAPRFSALGIVHKNRFPVWIPFGFWTALIANDSAVAHSIEDVVQRWLHHLACDALWPSVKAAMNDERLLLLIDGLDEYRSEAAAGVAVRQLQVFVDYRECPAIATSRPLGFQRLPAFSMEWERGTLADLTREQQKHFLSAWTTFWLTNSGSTESGTALPDRIASEAERFDLEVQQSSGLRELAGTPLLLGIVVYLRNSNLPLPQNRFQAYRRIVDHLITDHPRARQRAASLTISASEFTLDDLRKILAALAFSITVHNPEGVIERADAVKVVSDFLSDSELGFGYSPSLARQAAENVIVQGEMSLGIIVERAPSLCAFLHRAFQEHLCATHIASLRFEEQLQQLESHGADQQWREIILGLTYLTTRAQDVRDIVKRADGISGDSATRFGVDAMLCEIAAGPFQCPTDLSLTLCQRFIRDVETGPWMAQRLTLLRLLLGGIYSPKIRAIIKEKLQSWYPCRSVWRHDLYSVLLQTGRDEATIDILFRGLHDEEAYNQEQAAMAIAGLATDGPELAERLIAALSQPNSISVIAAAAQALLAGWPEHEVWNDLEDKLRHSASVELRLIGIRRRIRSHRHDDDDKEELVWMASRGGPFLFHRSPSGVVAALVDGWPADTKIRDRAIRDISQRVRYEGGFHSDAATWLLILGYKDDPVATKALCDLIRTEEHAFLSDSHSIWKTISERYVGNAEMIAAADEWLDRWSGHRYPEVSFAARLGWTPKAKEKLLANLNAWVPFWAADVLLERWGMGDEEVALGLTTLVESDKAADVGYLFPRILSDRAVCFSRLISMLESPDCLNPGSVLAGLCDVMESGEQERVLEAALHWAERTQVVGNREHVVRLLLERFSADARVQSFARKELRRRDGDRTAVLRAFGHIQDFRVAGTRMASPLPGELRTEVLSFLETVALTDREFIDTLANFDLESDPSLKTRATIAYCTAVTKTKQPTADLIAYLSEALVCGGPDYESRQQSAVCGLDILGHSELIASIRKAKQDPLPIDVMGVGRTNEAFVLYLLANWTRLQTSMGSDFYNTFFNRGQYYDVYWWSHVAALADNYPDVKEALVSYLSTVQGSQLYSELLLFLGRVRPRSSLLLDQCLKVIKNEGQSTGGWMEVDVAAYLLGRDFAGDETVLTAVLAANKIPGWTTDNVLWACCEGWPAADVVDSAFQRLKAGSNEDGIISVRSIVEMHLLCVKGTAEEVANGVMQFVAYLHTDLTYHAASYLRPIVRRVKQDESLQELLTQRLSSPRNTSEACSAAAILFRAVGLGSEVRRWCLEDAMIRSEGASLYSPVGFDLAIGLVRPKWEVGMDILTEFRII
jgi:hypothetical protein